MPIKVVFPQSHDYEPDTPGGSTWQPFEPVTSRVRRSLASKVKAVKTRLADSPPGVPAVAKVTLKPNAVAKSYRPTELFNTNTCPIIGGAKLGELFVGVSDLGLQKLEHIIKSGQTKVAVAHISTLSDIQPYTSQDVLGRVDIDQLIAKATEHADSRIRVRLFRHLSDAANQSIDDRFEYLVRELAAQDKSSVELMHYTDAISMYCIKRASKEHITELASFPGTQSISTFPDYRIVRTESHGICALADNHFPAPNTNEEYSIVGIIDSGTDPRNKLLQAWVVAREDFVPNSQQDNSHGSFVAGLAVHARRMNHNNQQFPAVSSKIVDIVAFDRTGKIDEYDLLNFIDLAIKKHPYVRVWNLSVGQSGATCSDHAFSEFAAALDDRSRRHNILFVIAAGNYREQPYRSWPAQDTIGENDRICAPADAVRAITVGSIAHLDTSNSRVKSGDPSPFSRRGPGPAYLIKPEVVYFGGNCDANGSCLQTGVVSLNNKRQLVEDAGCSFATPMGSTVAANVYDQLRVNGELVGPTLIKAILVHAAFLRSAPLDDRLVNYCGVGTPPDINEILGCDPSSCTLVFDVLVRSKMVFGKRPFPMPACLLSAEMKKSVGLRKKSFRGEVFMTLVYDPPMSHDKGFEYCRSNVNASLGVMRLRKGKTQYSREVHPAPRTLSSTYEEALVKHGYKWSPLKLYHRRFVRGPDTTEWRLTMEMLTRSETPLTEQSATLVITVRDPKRQANVYEEMIQQITRMNWHAQDLAVRDRQRGRVR